MNISKYGSKLSMYAHSLVRLDQTVTQKFLTEDRKMDLDRGTVTGRSIKMSQNDAS